MQPAADAREQLYAREIVDHLRSISRCQQTDHLLSLWSHTERRTMPAWGFRFHTDVSDDYDSRPWPEFLTPVPPPADDESWNDLRQRILEALADGNHPDATPFFLELVDQGPSVTRLALTARHFANSGRPMDSLILLEQRFMDLLAEGEYLLQHELPAVVDALNGPDSSSPEYPAWRRDTALVRRWPKLAFQLHRAMGSNRESTKRATLDAAGEIEFTAYDDDYLTTMDLATTSDMRVIAWAKAELAKLDSTPGMSGWTRSYLEHPLQRPLAVLLKRGDMADIEPAVLDLFCRGGEFRGAVIDILGYHGEQLDLLARMLATDGLNANERRRVADALVQVYGRLPYGDDLYYGDFDESGPTRFLLLADIVKGGKGPASPIPCPARH